MEAMLSGGEATAWSAEQEPFEAATPSDTTEGGTPEDTDDGFTDGFSSPEDDELRALGMSMGMAGGDLVGLDGDIPAWVELPSTTEATPTPPLAASVEAESPAASGRPAGGPPTIEGIVPPDSPPGEMFAASFLREFCTTGGLVSTGVWSLEASPGRKWGLERELPAGWYLLDRTAPGSASALTPFDVGGCGVCKWKVTGRQISEFNREMPIQTRYCNPKEGCSEKYVAMRAAVYTWCTEQHSGEIVESEQRLIHVYVGRASRKKSTRRKAGGASSAAASIAAGPVKPVFKSSGPAGAHRRAFNIQAPQSALQEHSNSLHVILKEVMEQLRAQNMDEAAAVVDAVVQKRFSAYRTSDAFSGSVLRPSSAKLIERTDVSMARMLVESLKEQERERIPPSLRRKLQSLCTRAEADLDMLDKTVHVLFMSRDASEDLHINRELQAIYDRVASTKGHPAAVPVVFTVVPNASAYTLWTTLTRAREHFSHIHFSGHGSDVSGSTLLLAASPERFDPHSRSGDEAMAQYQTDAPVNDRAFANAIAQYHNRLPANNAVKSVFLNACSTAEQGTALINHGIPYACVNDGQISDHVAVAFSSAFYEQIALDNAVTVAHERAVNWVMLNVNERAYKLGGINGLRLMSASDTQDEMAGREEPAPEPAPAPPPAPAAAPRTTKEVAELIRVDLGLTDSQSQTMKQLVDAAIAELGMAVAGSLRDRLQAVADELHIPTGWSSTPAAASAAGDSSSACAAACATLCGDSLCKAGTEWLKPWAHFGIDCPIGRKVICSLVAENGADRVRQALDRMWQDMTKRRGEFKDCGAKKCTEAQCLEKFLGTLKTTLSSSLQPAGQGSCSYRDCPMSKQIWGDREPSDEECAILKRLVKEMDFDCIAASIAVRETRGRGLHAAVEWLLQHLDSLTSLSAALESSRAATAAAPSAVATAEAAREERRAQLGQQAQQQQVQEQQQQQRRQEPDEVTFDQINRTLQMLGFDDDFIQTVHARLAEFRASADFLAAKTNLTLQMAVRIAFTMKLEEEAAFVGRSSASEELLAFMTASQEDRREPMSSESPSSSRLSPSSSSD